jgi:alkanesulfonate monooxygenase SsuD/methylene tetrahydromethanopterin reductase-like flavin-dependent oxidoreductase (luciferase family)
MAHQQTNENLCFSLRLCASALSYLHRRQTMLEIAIMIEGQNGLNWPRWQGIVRAVEELGFTGLYRSDHYTNANPPDKDSLELWVSLTWLAANTERIEFGPLVSPVSFRDPTMTARMASAVDDLSNGRLTLGLGAGWQEREHENFGWQLLDIPERFDRFEEGLTVISQLLQNDEPVDFEGEYYELNEAIVLPRPQRPGGAAHIDRRQRHEAHAAANSPLCPVVEWDFLDAEWLCQTGSPVG